VDGESRRIPLIAALSVAVTLAAVSALNRWGVRHAREELIVHPPFQPPDAAARARALGPLEGLPPDLRAALEDTNAFEPMVPPKAGDWLSAQHEPGQTFQQFVASHPGRPDAKRRALYIEPLALGSWPTAVEAPSVDVLARFAQAFFTTPVTALPPKDVDGLGITDRVNRDTHVRQLLTGDLLRFLGGRKPEDAFALLGLTMEDLYPGPSWNFVFGEASLTEGVGVYSLARYAPGPGGKPAPAKLILLRACKVLAHEAGHMFGIHHCIYWRCVMNGSNHLGELDARPLHLCPVCLRKLQWSVGFDVRERYRRLAEQARTLGFDDEARWLAARTGDRG
jgi:archaemetzincin